jgi:hypothetical protein
MDYIFAHKITKRICILINKDLTAFTINITEVEVTQIILTKVQEFCQLASRKRRSFSDLRFPGTRASLWIYFPQLMEGCMELLAFYLC